jgi:hypothetical protein
VVWFGLVCGFGLDDETRYGGRMDGRSGSVVLCGFHRGLMGLSVMHDK